MFNKGGLPSIISAFILVSSLLTLILSGCNSPSKTIPESTSPYTMPAIDPDIFQNSETTTPADGTAPDSKDQAPVDDATLVPLISQILQPSSSEQKVTWDNQVNVIVPGGLLAESETLTISQVDNASPDPFDGFAPLDAYDISLGNLKEFHKNLTIEMAYDPAKLPVEFPAGENLLAEYWVPGLNTWWRAVSQVDTQRNIVSISTDHLSRWRLQMLIRGDQEYSSNHFIVVWNHKEAPKIGGTPQDPKAFAKKVSGYLEAAWKVYFDERFAVASGLSDQDSWPADWPNNVEAGRTWVIISQDISESMTDSTSGDITLKSKYDNEDQLKQDTAHELFHTTHLRKVRMPTYIQSQWWAEACADYASTRIAWPNLSGMSMVSGDYFRAPLTTVDSIHEYETARLIEFLVKQGMTFNQLFNDMASAVPTPDTLSPIVQKRTGKSLLKQYQDFAAYVFFDNSSPIQGTALFPSLFQGIAGTKGAPSGFGVSDSQISTQMSVYGGYSAALWGFKAAASDPATARALTLKLTRIEGDPLDDKVSVNIYVLKKDQRPVGGTRSMGVLSEQNTAAQISVNDGDVVYVLGANSDTSGHGWQIDVDTQTPNLVTGNKPIAFTLHTAGPSDLQGDLQVSWQISGKGLIQNGAIKDDNDRETSVVKIDGKYNTPIHVEFGAKGNLSRTSERIERTHGDYALVTYSLKLSPAQLALSSATVDPVILSNTALTYDFTAQSPSDAMVLPAANAVVWLEVQVIVNTQYYDKDDVPTGSVSDDYPEWPIHFEFYLK